MLDVIMKLVTTVGAALVASGGLYWWYLWRRLCAIRNAKSPTGFQPSSPSMTAIMPYSEYKKRYTPHAKEIAIFALSKCGYTKSIAHSFTETIKEKGNGTYHFSYHYGNGSIQSISKPMADIIHAPCDLILAIGQACTQSAKHVTATHNTLIPTVFVNIHSEWWQRERKRHAVAHLTGILVDSTWHRILPLFFDIKPTMRNVLISSSIPYPVAEDRTVIDRFFAAKGVTITYMDASSTTDIVRLLPDYAGTIDSIILSNDPFSMQITRTIASFCTKYGITLFSSNLDDFNHGAAIVAGPENQMFGQRAALKALAILEEHQEPLKVPYTTLEASMPIQVRLNQPLLVQQGIDLDLLPDFILKHSSTIELLFDDQAKTQEAL